MQHLINVLHRYSTLDFHRQQGANHNLWFRNCLRRAFTTIILITVSMSHPLNYLFRADGYIPMAAIRVHPTNRNFGGRQ